jgi:hypothetical protein
VIFYLAMAALTLVIGVTVGIRAAVREGYHFDAAFEVENWTMVALVWPIALYALLIWAVCAGSTRAVRKLADLMGAMS